MQKKEGKEGKKINRQEIIKKAKNPFKRFHYPKLTLLLISIILAYFLFKNLDVNISNYLQTLGHSGMFLAGVVFSIGFLAPFAIGFFLTSNAENILLSAIIAGFGAMLANLIAFHFIRLSFMDEFKSLEKTKPIKEILYLIEKDFSHKIKHYLLYVFAGILLASPLPDEIADSMLAGFTKIKIFFLAIISFVLSVIGIFVLLSI